MSASFFDHIGDIEDPRVPGMIVYRLDEILLTVLVGLLCRAEDFDEIEDVGVELLDWLRRVLPFEQGVAPAQTLKRTLSRLNPRQLETAFAAWVKSLAGRISGVVAIDGKTVRGSKRDADGTGALHLVQAWAHEAGLLLAQRAVTAKSNEITAIPELLDMLALEGAIVTIDAMGTQKEIAARIVSRKADYVLALKGNQGTLKHDVALFFNDPALAADCACHQQDPQVGHGRIEERSIRAADATWLAGRHPDWKGLASILAVTVRRTIKKTGAVSTETRLFISSLPPDPIRLAAAVRAHWSVENNLHWALDPGSQSGASGNLPRRSVSRPQRLFSAQPGNHPTRRAQYAPPPACQNLAQAQTPQGAHEPNLPRSRPCMLTIHDWTLLRPFYPVVGIQETK